jgi:hypothetical protein
MDGPTAATAADAESAEPRTPCCTREATPCANIDADHLLKDALKPHAARVGMATYSSASELPKCASAAWSRAALDFKAAAADGSNSGTATLERTAIEATVGALPTYTGART